MANGAYIRVALIVITVACDTWYRIVITRRHLKIIPSTFGAILEKYHKWSDSASITVAPKLYSKYGSIHVACSRSNK